MPSFQIWGLKGVHNQRESAGAGALESLRREPLFVHLTAQLLADSAPSSRLLCQQDCLNT